MEVVILGRVPESGEGAPSVLGHAAAGQIKIPEQDARIIRVLTAQFLKFVKRFCGAFFFPGAGAHIKKPCLRQQVAVGSGLFQPFFRSRAKGGSEQRFPQPVLGGHIAPAGQFFQLGRLLE